jgi:hypothetical protein
MRPRATMMPPSATSSRRWDNRERGLNAVKLLLQDLGDVQRCTTLARELREAGKPGVAEEVEALRDAHRG